MEATDFMKANIVLASKSPRRIRMMREYGFDPIIKPSQAEETLPAFLRPSSAVMYLAFLKAWDVTQQLTDDHDQMTVIGSDTVVVFDDKIIGKPSGPSEAFRILADLKGNVHHVLTGVCIIQKDHDHFSKTCFYDKTDVYFKDYTDEELLAYVNTDEPYDKAGGYAIQETFSKYIDHIDGSFNNVVGFPIEKIIDYLK